MKDQFKYILMFWDCASENTFSPVCTVLTHTHTHTVGILRYVRLKGSPVTHGVCSGPGGVEGGLSWGGDETPLLLMLWVCWLVLRRSSSLKLLPEFCLKKPGLEICKQKNHNFS